MPSLGRTVLDAGRFTPALPCAVLCAPPPASADAASVFRGPGPSGSALLLPGVPRAPGLHLGLSLPELASCLVSGCRDASRTCLSLRGAPLVLRTPSLFPAAAPSPSPLIRHLRNRQEWTLGLRLLQDKT